MKNKFYKLPFIIFVAAILFIFMCIYGIQSAQNKAIHLEESILQADSDIKVQEKRRVDLIYNLADAVKSYGEHESETFKNLANGMSKGNNIEDVQTAIAAVTYAYPELKSNENYKELMNELSMTENLIAQHRENYNKSVTKYNNYVKGFPARLFLKWTGYEVQEMKRLDYDAPSTAPQNLFD